MFQQILETNRPTAALKRTLWDDVKKVAWSSNEVSRVVHTNSNRHWSDSEDLALVTRFNALVLEKAGQGRTYKQASKVQRKSVIQALSLEFHRSPMAIIIRAKGLKLIVALSPTPVTPVVPSVNVSESVVTPSPTVDATTAAILAIMAQNAKAVSQPQEAASVAVSVAVPPVPAQEAYVAPEAPSPHMFGNSKLRSMYSA